MLVAPVTVGKGALIGAGSTITKNVPRTRWPVPRRGKGDRGVGRPQAPGASQESGALRPRGQEGEEVTCAASSAIPVPAPAWRSLWTACGGGVPRVRFGGGRDPDRRGIAVRKSQGKIDRLTQCIAKEPVSGTCGVGHTRWATHGRPSDENAHPHLAGRVAVIHNGSWRTTGRSRRR